MADSFKATLGDSNPFSLNKVSGRVDVDLGDLNISVLKPEQKEIITRVTSLIDNNEFTVEVNAVGNDESFMDIDGSPTTLRQKEATGYSVYPEGNNVSVYISKQPLVLDGDKFIPHSPSSDMRGLTSIHEIGGHAYYYMAKLPSMYDKKNWKI